MSWILRSLNCTKHVSTGTPAGLKRIALLAGVGGGAFITAARYPAGLGFPYFLHCQNGTWQSLLESQFFQKNLSWNPSFGRNGEQQQHFDDAASAPFALSSLRSWVIGVNVATYLLWKYLSRNEVTALAFFRHAVASYPNLLSGRWHSFFVSGMSD